MKTLTPIEKDQLLKQVKMQGEKIDVKQIVELINKYDGLKKEDFAPPVLPTEIYQGVIEQLCDPAERNAWNGCKAAANINISIKDDTTTLENSLNNLQTAENTIKKYISRYQMVEESHVNDANVLLDEVRDKIEDVKTELKDRKNREQEEKEWGELDKDKYSELINFLHRYPKTRHRDEIDDFMWRTVTNGITPAKLARYIENMPEGRHVSEAYDAQDSYSEWEEVKRTGDIIAIKKFIDMNPSCPFIREARNKFFELKDEKLEDMKENPSDYTFGMLEPLFDAGIFTKDELMDEGLITDHSWEMLTRLDREMLPPIDQTPNPNIKAREGCTDIFFFGTPSTGKTCLLMGLAGANGKGYSLQMVDEGGPYISDLTIYAKSGITPDATFGSFVTVINGTITEHTKGGSDIKHNINLVEMSGEEFALKIAQNPQNKVRFEDMGTGATNLLMNNNRKVFFIIVDPTKLMIPFRHKDPVYNEGKVIDHIVRKKYISQDIILNKLTSLFTLPENQKIMERVDAIHFIVTKADTLGDARSERDAVARKKLNEDYLGAVEQLKEYVKKSKRINASTNFQVKAFTFSLGHFYLGDVFELDSTDTIELIETIRNVTFGHKEPTWWDYIKNFLN